MEQMPKKQHLILLYAALALATFIAYEQVRHNNFVDYDDTVYVSENPQVLRGLTGESISWAFTTRLSANWHPLTWLSHMLDCQLFGANVGWHHLTSLLLHIANTLLLFWVLKKMTDALWPSLFVAAAFALHPLHVESVAWVAERKDVLSGLFWMLTIACYIRYTEQPSIKRYLLVFVVFALGLMAKPMLVTLPFVLLLLDYWPLGRFQFEHQSKHQKWLAWHLIREKIPLFALVAASSIVTYVVQQSEGAMEIGKSYPLSLRISNAAVSYVVYIGKLIYPRGLAVLYPYPVDGLPAWQPIVSLLILAGVSAGVIYTAKRYRYLAVGWLWYLGTLVPVIGLVQVGDQARADRYTYLPSVGLFIMVAWGAVALAAKLRYRKIALGICAGIVLAIFLICTRLQVRYWQNSFTLFERTLSATENNYIMHHNLGLALQSQTRLDEAISHYRQALQLKPDYVKAHNNLGIALQSQSKYDEAIEHVKKAVQLDPNFALARYNLGSMYYEQGRYELAVTHWTKALELNPDLADALNLLSWILATTKDTKLHNPIEAVKYAQRACESTEYNRPDFLDTLAAAYAAAGRFPEAVETAEKAVALAMALEQKELAINIQKRLELYRAKIPYYEK
jgi:Tfp pilus assembly protein PilF